MSSKAAYPKPSPSLEPSRTRAWMIILPLLAIWISGCSRENKIYPDAPVAIAEDPPITVDGRALLPQGFYNQSVNRALVDVALDGVTTSSKAIRLQTLPGTNDAGSFNGTGEGNRALLGLANHADTKLADLTGFTFDAKTFVGSQKISVLFIADLACDGSMIRVFNASGAALGAGSPNDNGYVRYSARFTEARWKANGPAIVDPDDADITLVPGAADAQAPTDLNALIAKFPDACLKNVASGDADLPKNLPTASVLFALGESDTTDANGAFINRITVGDDVYEGLE